MFKQIIAALTLAATTIILLSGCDEKSNEPEPEPPQTHTVRVPSEIPTIEAALDSVQSGDTILVADGIYTGEGNRDIIFPCKKIVLMSENGPRHSIIDCEGDTNDLHFGFMFTNCDSTVIIDGFTIKNAYYNLGAAIACQSFDPHLINCILVDNHATVSGGAVRCKSTSPTFSDCTIARNSTDMVGAGFFLIAGAQPLIENSIISHSTAGEAIYSSEGTSIPVLTCCDIYGNAGGDWTDNISGQYDGTTNLSSDPEFCDSDNDDFRIESASPCAAANNQCGVRIGALPAGCD